MRNWRSIIGRFHQFGGIKLLFSYFRVGVGSIVVKQVYSLLIGTTSRDVAYSVIRRSVLPYLHNKYDLFIKSRKSYYDSHYFQQGRSRKVWTCWLQGFDSAPEIVKVCQRSIDAYLSDYEIIRLTNDNYSDYVTLPEDIVLKYRKGIIPAALFTDLIRLEVLIKEGGTWIDASVLCTGDKDISNIFDCDLFMFQTLRGGDYCFRGASNWFITACKGNRLLMVLRDVLIRYWLDFDVTLDYYMFHDFFYAISKLYPKEILAMPRKDRVHSLLLMKLLNKPYNSEIMKELTELESFHKLSWRLLGGETNDGTFYRRIIEFK